MVRASEQAHLREALRALRARRGPPTEADVPRVRPLPGKRIRLIPGQLDLKGHVHDGSRDVFD